MSRRAKAPVSEADLVDLAFRELHLGRSKWRIEVILASGWVGVKVRHVLGRTVERGASFTVKTSASDRTKKFLELVRSAVDELSADPE